MSIPSLKKKTHDTRNATHIQTKATEALQLKEPPKVDDSSALCHKAIATIISKANRKITDSLRKKEDLLYKNSPNRYHKNLTTATSLQPNNAKYQPNLATIRDPTAKKITTKPNQILNILRTHFEKEHSRNKPEQNPLPPWRSLPNPDPYTTIGVYGSGLRSSGG